MAGLSTMASGRRGARDARGIGARASDGRDPAGDLPPRIDEGDPPLRLSGLLRLLTPTVGRFGNTCRVVATVCLLITLTETFRVPQPAVGGFLAIFISKDDRAFTLAGAKLLAIFGTMGISLSVVVFAATLSQPALRVATIAAISFVMMFLSRAARNGLPFFLVGFLLAFILTDGDELSGFGQQAGTVSNVVGGEVPYAAFFPPEEALVHTVLWLALMPLLAATAVAVINGLFGRDAASMLSRELLRRLQAVAAACRPSAGSREARALQDLALEGMPGPAALGGRVDRRRPGGREVVAAVQPVGRLVVGTLAWLRVRQTDGADERGLAAGSLAPMAPAVAHWCRALAGGPADVAAMRRASKAPHAPDPGGDPVLVPLAGELQVIGSDLSAAFGTARPPADSPAAKPPGGLLREDAFRNPEHVRFAIRVTLSAMLCYLCYRGLDWGGIQTAMVTCFFVPQDSLGQTVHKAALRIAGALLGGALGIATILWLMPLMTSLWQLLPVVAVVMSVGGWIWNGSTRIAYSGLQLNFAYLLTVLQGFGPTLDMQTARDRVVGIVLGIAVTSAVFATLWPVRVADKVRPALADALNRLAAAVSLGGDRAEVEAQVVTFSRAVTGVRELMAYDPFERPVTRDPATAIDAAMLASMQALSVPVAMVRRLAADAGIDGKADGVVAGYHAALSEWLRAMADAIRERLPARRFAGLLPPGPPATGIDPAQREWYGRLDARLRGIVARLAGEPGAMAAEQP